MREHVVDPRHHDADRHRPDRRVDREAGGRPARPQTALGDEHRREDAREDAERVRVDGERAELERRPGRGRARNAEQGRHRHQSARMRGPSRRATRSSTEHRCRATWPRPPVSPYGLQRITTRLDIERFNAQQSRYRIDAPLGRGGMSTVYRGRELALDRRSRSSCSRRAPRTTSELRSQQQEARLLASFAHHSLVRLFDVGVDFLPDGSPRMFLVMELVDGTDLRAGCAAARSPCSRSRTSATTSRRASRTCTRRASTHRDVKPANVLLVDGSEGRRPRVKLADLGIAADRVAARDRDRGRDGRARRRTSAPSRPPARRPAPAADVYGLGLVRARGDHRAHGVPRRRHRERVRPAGPRSR